MGKGIQVWTEPVIERRFAEGYGSGEGSNYIPWIGTHDVASKGRTHRPWSPIYGRTFQLLSDVEWQTFLLLEHSRKFAELYEGYPLERKITLEIAAALGIRHPHYPGTNVPTVMTVDFLAVDRRGTDARIAAFDSKRSEEMDGDSAEGSIAKLQITRAYFAGMNVPHHLVLHSQLNQRILENIEWIRSGIAKKGEIEPYDGYFNEKVDQMLYELMNGSHTCSLGEYCRAFDERHGMQLGDASRVARMLLWDRRLKCDLRNSKASSLPVNSFLVERDYASRRAVGQ
ncbi:TnsA endonuclease N-terminal domain-containing protein [Paraburkholderia sp. USG1]|uniref:TnsA endonuclease C-terminal domain-containing protein n=1 Tax=Paraburkholderia sp. USG1 TaxID=2952268 RepID=UPI002855EF97|nr:TnsA endonuclease C-terminal domain-containing protein [Paraburkholderia sp. USG1]MDR8401859.1 TnsA endonuclease N-terminal domain-containing protein [Paraburkholderia sp. USG1]